MTTWREASKVSSTGAAGWAPTATRSTIRLPATTMPPPASAARMASGSRIQTRRARASASLMLFPSGPGIGPVRYRTRSGGRQAPDRSGMAVSRAGVLGLDAPGRR
jgi:hypothetical protein